MSAEHITHSTDANRVGTAFLAGWLAGQNGELASTNPHFGSTGSTATADAVALATAWELGRAGFDANAGTYASASVTWNP